METVGGGKQSAGRCKALGPSPFHSSERIEEVIQVRSRPCPWTGPHTRPWLGSRQRCSPGSPHASRVARDRAARMAFVPASVLGTAAVRVSARWMSWLIPWSGWRNHPGRFPFFYGALQHEALTKAERSPVLNEALSLCDPPCAGSGPRGPARLSCLLAAERYSLRQPRRHGALERPSFGRSCSIL